MKGSSILQLLSLCFLYSGPMGVSYVIHGYGAALFERFELSFQYDITHQQKVFLILFSVPILLVCLTTAYINIRKNVRFKTILDRGSIILAEMLPLGLVLSINFSVDLVIMCVLLVTGLRFESVTILSQYKKVEYVPLFNGMSVFLLSGQMIYFEGSRDTGTLSLLVSLFISYRIYSNSLPTIRKLRNVLQNK